MLRRSFAAALLCPALAAAQGGGIRLLVQGDDMGALHGINTGTIRAYKEGIVRATNVIVPGPWMLEAARLLNDNPGLDAGVHLTLTSEWPFVKWRPLTFAPSVADQNGYFFPVLSPARGANPKADEVERELRAQIEMARRLIPHVNHMSTHMAFARPFPEIAAVVEKLARECGLALAGDDPGIQSIGQVFRSGRGQPFEDGAVKAEKLAKRLETLEPGTWRMVEHAAVNDPEMQAITGAQDVAAEREAVLRAWTSPRVLEVVRRRHIRLIGYRDILKPGGAARK